MAPLTWRNVDAPDLSAAANMQARAAQGIREAFAQGGQIGRGIFDDQTEAGSRDAMASASQFTTSADWTNALANGTAFGSVDPRFINTETMAWGAQQRGRILGEEQTVQNMEIQRAQEARAQEAHRAAMAARAAAAAGGGGRRPSGGSGGTGGGSSGSTDASRMEVARLRGLATIAESEGNAEEARALREQAAGLAYAGDHREDFTNTAAELAELNIADRAAAEEAADTRAADALAGLSNEAGGLNYGALSGIAPPAPGSAPVPPPAASPSPAAPPPAPTSQPAAPAAPAVVEEAPASPVASLGFDMGTPVDQPGSPPASGLPGSGNRPVTPAAPGGAQPYVQPELSFGESVPAMAPTESQIDPMAWRNMAQEQRVANATPTTAAVLNDLPEFVQEMPEYAAYVDAHNRWESSVQGSAEARQAEVDRDFINPDQISNIITETRATFEGARASNPDILLMDNRDRFQAMASDGDVMAIASAVGESLGIPSNQNTQLATDIQNFAESNGTDVATAAAAMVAARQYDEYNFWWDAPWSETTYYNEREARETIERMGSGSTLESIRANQNNMGRLQSQSIALQNGFENSYRSMVEAGARYGTDSQEYADAYQATLDADKAIVEFSTGLRNTLREQGLDLRSFEDTPEAMEPQLQDFLPQERIDQVTEERAQAQAAYERNMEMYGRATPPEEPEWNAFGDFNPQSTPSSIMGQNMLGVVASPDNIASTLMMPRQAETLFNWVEGDEAATEQVFAAINEAEYRGEDITLPAGIEEGYQSYLDNTTTIPETAIQGLANLGFDLSDEPDFALAVANDPNVREAIQNFNRYDSFWTSDEVRKMYAERAQETIRGALYRARSGMEPRDISTEAPEDARTMIDNSAVTYERWQNMSRMERERRGLPTSIAGWMMQ